MAGKIEALKKRIEDITKLEGEDLLPNEKLLYDSFSSWYGEVSTLLLSGVALIIAFLVVVYFLIVGTSSFVLFVPAVMLFAALLMVWMSAHSHYSVRYFVTSERVLKRYGLLSKHLDGVPYDKIQNIEMHKRLGEKLVDIGDIFIDVAGGPGLELVLNNLPDPEKPHRLINDMMMSKKRL